MANTLASLPRDIHFEILGHLSSADIARLALSSRSFLVALAGHDAWWRDRIARDFGAPSRPYESTRAWNAANSAPEGQKRRRWRTWFSAWCGCWQLKRHQPAPDGILEAVLQNHLEMTRHLVAPPRGAGTNAVREWEWFARWRASFLRQFPDGRGCVTIPPDWQGAVITVGDAVRDSGKQSDPWAVSPSDIRAAILENIVQWARTTGNLAALFELVRCPSLPCESVIRASLYWALRWRRADVLCDIVAQENAPSILSAAICRQIWKGDDRAVADLIEAGAFGRLDDRQVRHVLKMLSEHGRFELLGKAAAAVDKVPVPLLFLAARFGSAGLARLAIEAGAPVNCGRRTPLSIAVSHKHQATAAFLLAAGADVRRLGKRQRELMAELLGAN